jgi:flavin-dependent dehydrogenase
VGPGWALAGDAFGFVDPVFSSGLLLAFDAAEALSKALLGGHEESLQRYERRVLRNLETWHRVCGYFYNGRLFTLFKVGEIMRTQWFWRMLDFHFVKHMPRVFTGEATNKRYSVGLLDFMVRHGLAGNDPQNLAVR